jgi:hypothetical protein
MLAVSTYPREYVDSCRARMLDRVASFQAVVAAARSLRASSPELDASLAELENAFFNDLIVVMDSSFVHRTRALEKKDGNALNEVRVMTQSIMTNDGVMAADKTITLNPEASVLKYAVGDEIRLTEDDFIVICDAFFDEIDRKFTTDAG